MDRIVVLIWLGKGAEERFKTRNAQLEFAERMSVWKADSGGTYILASFHLLTQAAHLRT